MKWSEGKWSKESTDALCLCSVWSPEMKIKRKNLNIPCSITSSRHNRITSRKKTKKKKRKQHLFVFSSYCNNGTHTRDWYRHRQCVIFNWSIANEYLRLLFSDSFAWLRICSVVCDYSNNNNNNKSSKIRKWLLFCFLISPQRCVEVVQSDPPPFQVTALFLFLYTYRLSPQMMLLLLLHAWCNYHNLFSSNSWWWWWRWMKCSHHRNKLHGVRVITTVWDCEGEEGVHEAHQFGSLHKI